MKILLQKFLDANGYATTYPDFETHYRSHPDYPSLYSITDSLSATGIENLAVQIPKDRIDDVPELFLALLGRDFVMVKRVSDGFHLESEKGTKRSLSVENFVSQWDGIILAVEPRTVLKTKVSVRAQPFWPILPFTLLVLLSMTLSNHNFFSVGMLGLSLTGILVAVFAMRQKLGIQTPVVDGFCRSGSNVSCSEVIKNGNAQLPVWLPLTDMPLVYFASASIALLLEPSSASLVGYASVIAAPVVLYSIWFQKFQLKKWCVLCLIIGATAIAQAVLFTQMYRNTNVTVDAVFVVSISALLVGVGWFALKPVIENNIEMSQKEQSLLRFKRNFELFRYLSEPVVDEGQLEEMNGIRLGNPEAVNRLSLFVSPSCGHCYKAVEDAFAMTEKYGDKIAVNILFNLNADNADNPYTEVALRFLSLNAANPEAAQKALSDWFIGRFELETWLDKWKRPFTDFDPQAEIRFQHEWCKSSDIVYTPAKILNGKMFPKGYELDEVRYFFNELMDLNGSAGLKAV